MQETTLDLPVAAPTPSRPTLRQAHKHRRNGDFQAAAEAYRQLLARNAAEVGALYGLSVVLRGQGQAEEAADLARRAVALAPDDAAGQFALARALADLGRYEGAAEGYRAAFRSGLIDHAGAVRQAARVFRQSGATAEAAATLGLAAAEKPGPDIFLEVAELWQTAGRPAEAVAWYRRAAARVPDRAPIEAALERARAEAREQCGQVPPPQMPQDEQLVEAMFRVRALAAADWAGLRFTPLGGKHNRLYRIDDASTRQSYALRLPGFPPASWWRYRREQAHLANGCALGLAPETLYFEPSDGVLLMRFLGGQRLRGSSLQDAALVERVAAAFRRLHDGPRVPGVRDLTPHLENIERRIGGAPRPDIPEMPAFAEQCREWRALLKDNGVAPRSCHNDPTVPNMIDTPDGLKLVDWEFAGLSDPDFELGYLLGNTRRFPQFEQVWLGACYGGRHHPRASRAAVYRAVLKYYWLLKSLLAQKNGQPPETWQNRARLSLAFLRSEIAGPEFRARLAEVRAYRWCPADDDRTVTPPAP